MARLSRGRADDSRDEPPAELTVNVRIEEPGGTFNTYSYDQQRGTLRLTGVHHRPPSGIERGAVLNTLSEEDGPLEALIVVASPTSKGCIVEARVVGGVAVSTPEAGKLYLVGVPVVGSVRARVRRVDELLVAERQAIGAAAASEHRQGPLRWISCVEAEAVVREATKAYWENKAKTSGVRYAAAWKAHWLSGRRASGDEAEPHTWAEYLVPSLPFRFQGYVEELLLPDERLLFFVERPSFVRSGAWGLLRHQKLRQGLLAITDRQVMVMLDSLPPDSTMVAWGYIAKASAVERLTGAWLDSRDSTCEIGFDLDAAGGAERYTMTFPVQHAEALQEGVSLLKGFARPPVSTVVRRLYDDNPPAGLPRSDDEEVDLEAKYPHLHDLLARVGEDNVLAAAAARPVEGRGLGPALALTTGKLIVFDGGSHKDLRARCQEYPVAGISSVEITQSLVGCRFEVFTPAAEEVDKVTLRYNYPDAPPFLKAFITLRHLLGQPIPLADEPNGHVRARGPSSA
jgi:inorganic pyrophosphatase